MRASCYAVFVEKLSRDWPEVRGSRLRGQWSTFQELKQRRVSAHCGLPERSKLRGSRADDINGEISSGQARPAALANRAAPAGIARIGRRVACELLRAEEVARN